MKSVNVIFSATLILHAWSKAFHVPAHLEGRRLCSV